MGIFFKRAEFPEEFDQIHRLNYETFVEEIPQHYKNQEKVLIDSFHINNTYLIARTLHEVVAMIAIHDTRPFSLEKKIGVMEQHLPIKPDKLCEVRLLAVKKQFRKTTVFIGLMRLLLHYCKNNGYDAAIISGTVRQIKLYKHMGFVEFAHLVGTKEALYQPMYVTTQTFEQASPLFLKETSFLPGPVTVTQEVWQAFSKETISHREQSFMHVMKDVQTKLKQLSSSDYVEILLGSGTLANDSIAAQLTLLEEEGLILVNGEFGERLAERAKRFQLSYRVVTKEWGQPFSEKEIISQISTKTKWIWFVHCETSTGMDNQLEMIKKIGKDYHIKLVVDCISSIGVMPLNLEAVYLASGVSGKGLASITGLSFVFHNHSIQPSNLLPPYLDLGLYQQKESIPFSHSSHLLHALSAALNRDWQERFHKVSLLFQLTYNELEKAGFQLLTKRLYASTTILTIFLDKTISSVRIGDMMKDNGYQLHYESTYLQSRNLIQISLMNDLTENQIKKMVRTLLNVYKFECNNQQLIK